MSDAQRWVRCSGPQPLPLPSLCSGAHRVPGLSQFAGVSRFPSSSRGLPLPWSSTVVSLPLHQQVDFVHVHYCLGHPW